ncbi:hypothetical protein [Mitsuokella jalaludinii]|uniref:hypothetical protein n=1 Tax=Mitsuokella jalaludinii TaxID=187979 RepID=UPI00307A4740
MGTDTNEIIYDTLVRIEKKCDEQAQQINQIDRRLAVLEANAEEQRRVSDRLAALEADKNKVMGAKEIAIGIVSAVISGTSIFAALK